jgi:RES domain-containing protein
MIVAAWRIVQDRHRRTAFDGEGARRYPGRWNERGEAVVYTAGSLSLAALELLVHLGNADLLKRYVCIPLRFDGALCRRLDPASLPADWAQDPPPLSTRAIGSAWLAAGTSPVLAVPSAVVPRETVFLLNPLHPAFPGISIGAADTFRFDPRLLKS